MKEDTRGVGDNHKDMALDFLCQVGDRIAINIVCCMFVIMRSQVKCTFQWTPIIKSPIWKTSEEMWNCWRCDYDCQNLGQRFCQKILSTENQKSSVDYVRHGKDMTIFNDFTGVREVTVTLSLRT
jgi:hypothetical protein